MRHAYAAAVIRLVNGLVDPLQAGAYARPITAIAQQLGLPAWPVSQVLADIALPINFVAGAPDRLDDDRGSHRGAAMPLRGTRPFAPRQA